MTIGARRTGDEPGRETAPAAAPAAVQSVAPATPASTVVGLQRSAGNASVARFVGQRPPRGSLQRAPDGGATAAPPAPAPAMTADDLLKKHGTLYLGPRKYAAMDEDALGAELAPLAVAGQIGLVHQVFDGLMTSDRDDVAEVLSKTAGAKALSDEGLKVRLIREMLDSVVEESAEQQVTELWLSFGEAGLAKLIPNQTALWKLSLDECQPLVDHFKPDLILFQEDIMGAARAYLKENRKLVLAEGGNVGLKLADGAPAVSQAEADAYFLEMQQGAKIVLQLQGIVDDLKSVPVGYQKTAELTGKLTADISGEGADAEAFERMINPPPDALRQYAATATFDPDAKPDYAPTGKDAVEMAPWTEVDGHFRAVTAMIDGYARVYPAIHASLASKTLTSLADTANASKARTELETTLKGTLKAIADSEGKIGNGISHYDLVPIQQQLFANALAPPAKATRDWSQPLYSALGHDELKKQKANQFWLELGIGMASAFALIAAPFTGGLSAAVLVGAGVGASAGMAAASWDKYLNLRPLENASVRDDLSLIQKGVVDAALLEATVATVGTFLDAMSVGAAMKGAAKVNRAKALAELSGSVEAHEAAAQARMKLTNQGLKDAGMAVAGGAVAVGLHELEELEEPEITVTGGGISLDVAKAGPADGGGGGTLAKVPIGRTGGGMPQVMRTPQQLKSAQKAMAAIDAGPMPAHWGDRFELSVLSSVLRGEVQGMEHVTYAFRAQHKSGQGIDIIAFGKGPDGKISVFQIECKWNSGFRPTKLGGSSAGIQTSESWTKDNIAKWFESASSVEKNQLMRAVQAANGGKALTERQVSRLIAEAPVMVAAPIGAGAAGMMRKVWGQMSALARAGRKIAYREFVPR